MSLGDCIESEETTITVIDSNPVFLMWEDSYGVGSTWEEFADKSTIVPHMCFSVGWIVKETKDAIVIVPHISPPNEQIGAVECGCGDMVIPKSAIRDRRDLRQAYNGEDKKTENWRS